METLTSLWIRDNRSKQERQLGIISKGHPSDILTAKPHVLKVPQFPYIAWAGDQTFKAWACEGHFWSRLTGCITNYHKLAALKPQWWIFSQFRRLEVRSKDCRVPVSMYGARTHSVFSADFGYTWQALVNVVNWIWNIPHRFMGLNTWSPAVALFGGGNLQEQVLPLGQPLRGYILTLLPGRGCIMITLSLARQASFLLLLPHPSRHDGWCPSRIVSLSKPFLP